MIIYEMTATFGKLERQTLTLKPGMNIIEAPNEWGKSTWCAFLVTMLYGMDTRAKTTKTALADKEKYAPWSGSPMEGRIDLNWNGRDITIERRSKGRTPLGVFQAYETATGLEIPELTGANCGQMLLGVERSVFARAGFIRQADLPVTQDDALRRRLNALVTTGDESGAAEMLSGKLRDLKNSVRYNRSGKLPAAEAELAELEEKQRELRLLHGRMEECRRGQAETEQELEQLRNHQAALRYAAAQEDARRVGAAEKAVSAAKLQLEELERKCAGLPDREAAEENLRSAQDLQRQLMAMQMESQLLPREPERPEPPEPFRGIPTEQMIAKTKADGAEYDRLRQSARRKNALPWIVLAVAAAAGVGLGLVQLWLGIGIGAVLAAAAAAWLLTDQRHRQADEAQAEKMADRYLCRDTALWLSMAESYVNQRADYEQKLKQYHDTRGELDQRYERLHLQVRNLTQGQDLQIYMTQWQQVLTLLADRDRAREEAERAEAHWQGIRAMAKPAQAPGQPDSLTWNEADTARLIAEGGVRLRQLQLQMGQYQGRMEAIGDKEELRRAEETLRQRISRLEQMYGALELAQKTLQDAAAELQRRFAPRIAARAQELFEKLTEGRYNRLTLTQELAVNAGGEGETTLRSAQWRSDGTGDQLYLALRLAVAEELTPKAPLILDDALVRFDDRRLARAMELLSAAAGDKQVILFTCQSRESDWKKRNADYF